VPYLAFNSRAFRRSSELRRCRHSIGHLLRHRFREVPYTSTCADVGMRRDRDTWNRSPGVELERRVGVPQIVEL